MDTFDYIFFITMAVIWTIFIIFIVIPAPSHKDDNSLITNNECVTICHDTAKNNTTLSSRWQIQSKNTS